MTTNDTSPTITHLETGLMEGQSLGILLSTTTRFELDGGPRLDFSWMILGAFRSPSKVSRFHVQKQRRQGLVQSAALLFHQKLMVAAAAGSAVSGRGGLGYKGGFHLRSHRKTIRIPMRLIVIAPATVSTHGCGGYGFGFGEGLFLIF